MRVWNLRIDINPIFFVILLISYFFGEVNRIIIAEIFIVLHELVHVVSAMFMGKITRKISMLPLGVKAYIDLRQLSNKRKLIIYCAGPIFNGIVCVLALNLISNINCNKLMKLIFEVNLAILFFNIIPIKPLDGWNILNCVRNYGNRKI